MLCPSVIGRFLPTRTSHHSTKSVVQDSGVLLRRQRAQRQHRGYLLRSTDNPNSGRRRGPRMLPAKAAISQSQPCRLPDAMPLKYAPMLQPSARRRRSLSGHDRMKRTIIPERSIGAGRAMRSASVGSLAEGASTTSEGGLISQHINVIRLRRDRPVAPEQLAESDRQCTSMVWTPRAMGSTVEGSRRSKVGVFRRASRFKCAALRCS